MYACSDCGDTKDWSQFHWMPVVVYMASPFRNTILSRLELSHMGNALYRDSSVHNFHTHWFAQCDHCVLDIEVDPWHLALQAYERQQFRIAAEHPPNPRDGTFGPLAYQIWEQFFQSDEWFNQTD